MSELTANLLDVAVRIAEGERSASEHDVESLSMESVVRLVDESPSQRLQCIDRILVGTDACTALQFLNDLGALSVLLPEVAALVGFHEDFPVHHKDLWKHTLEVLNRTPPEADLRWVALLHDVGKVATRRLSSTSQVTFTRHEQLGAYLFGGIAARFGFPQERAERISFILSYHGRVNAYETDWTDRAIRRLVRDLGPHLDDILAFAGADYTTKRRRKQAHIRERLQQLVVRIQQQRLDGVTTSKVPAGLGQAIIGDLNVERGPAVGAWIAWIEDQVQKGELDEVPTLSTCLKAIRRAQHEGLTP